MIDFNLGKKIAFGRSQEVPMPEAAGVPATSALHALHTGDLIRIDGAAGTVEILQRIGVARP